MKAIAPGKIILSGEHAVIHGLPAIAMAVNRFAEATVSEQSSNLISFDILNLSYHKTHTIQALRKLKHRLSTDYQKFLRGEYSIREVLKKPFELSQYALTSFLEKLNLSLHTGGIKLSTQSSIPIGCGMGSSAAMILSVMHAMREYFKIEVNTEHYLSYGMEIENLQHGQSSGLDLQISLTGGCLRYEKGNILTRPIPDFPMYLVNTGSPESSTGECVSHTKSLFKERHLHEQFSEVTNQLDTALLQNDLQAIKQSIKTNHRLLIHLGIVPERIQRFIFALEQAGAAAKICGAGSIVGHHAGIVLIISENNPVLLCKEYGFHCSQIKGEPNGLRTV